MIVAILLTGVISVLVGMFIARLLVRPKCAGILYLCKHANDRPMDMYTELSSPPDDLAKNEFVYFKVRVSNVKSQN